jgi:hypothetical protein
MRPVRLRGSARRPKDLLGIERALPVEDLAHPRHCGKILRRIDRGHRLALFESDAVLARNRTAQIDRHAQDLVAGFDHGRNLFLISLVIADQRVQITVTGMEDIGHGEVMVSRNAFDGVERSRERAAPHADILHVVVRGNASHGARGAFASGP